MTAMVVQIGDELKPNAQLDEGILRVLADRVLKGVKAIRSIGTEELVTLFDSYGQELQRSPIRDSEGVMFLSMWLREKNIRRILALNFDDPKVLSEFIIKNDRHIKAQPRGLICHWIAGNVPTLGLFSLFQSLLVGNANILRIPAESVPIMRQLLDVMANAKASVLMESFAVVTFPSSDKVLNAALSKIADGRIVWGGQEAVEAITGLPHQGHCEDLIFGPKYSFAVIDSKALGSPELAHILRRLVNDILIFDQSACSSPHVLFFENTTPPNELLDKLAKEFTGATKKSPKEGLETSIAIKIIEKRAEYALDANRDIRCSEGNDWTILLDNHLGLEEPVQSRTLFIKPVTSILDVVPFVTKRVQTIGCEIHDETKLMEFADKVTERGVARCVHFGQMNNYDNPWDGIMVLSRLVRWCSCSK